MIEGQFELVNVCFARDVQFVAHVLNANNVTEYSFAIRAEFQNGKRIHGERMLPAERQDLDSDVWQPGCIREPLQLFLHHLSIAPLPVQDGLIQQRHIFQRPITGQELLADEASLQTSLDCSG
jgi:hypothetical protein